jgi:hypothetical protein
MYGYLEATKPRREISEGELLELSQIIIDGFGWGDDII